MGLPEATVKNPQQVVSVQPWKPPRPPTFLEWLAIPFCSVAIGGVMAVLLGFEVG